MNDNQLFQKTRWRLTLWYTSVMGVILAVCGLGLYEAIAHAHHVTLNREIKSVAGTFHDSLELTLQEPGKLEPEANSVLPSLCLVKTDCSQNSNSSSHQVGGISQGSYYLRLLNTSGHLVAVAGIQPKGLVRLAQQQPWEHLKDQNGIRYHQISLTLETKNNRPWGIFR